MGRQAVQNAVLKVGEGEQYAGMLRFQNAIHVDKGYIYRNTRINSTWKMILTGEVRHAARDQSNTVAESVVARLRPRKSESTRSIPGQSGQFSLRNCPDRPWELSSLLPVTNRNSRPAGKLTKTCNQTSDRHLLLNVKAEIIPPLRPLSFLT